jgi:hypothetical protein
VLHQSWQLAVLAAIPAALLVSRGGVVETLIGARIVGVIAPLAGAPAP